jgi:outer membrane protein OmpA-like peptidoglycan-associated protein
MSNRGHRTRPRLAPAAILLAVALGGVGCATRGGVRSALPAALPPVRADLAGVADDLERTRTRAMALEAPVDDHAERLDSAASTLELALESAEKVLADEGHPTVLLRDDSMRFAVGSARLDADATTRLDAFAARLLAHDRPVQVEIHGYPDAPGEAAEVGEPVRLASERAAAVARYLRLEHGIPLHRLHPIGHHGKPFPAPGSGGGATVDDAPERAYRRVTLIVIG